MTAPTQLKKLTQQPEKIVWFQFRLLAWSTHNWRDFPWRRTTDPYCIFVAESLLQKTDAAKVLPIYQAFIARYPDFQSLAIAPLPELANLLQPLGLFFRAKRLSQAAQIVAGDWNNTLPQSAKALMQLPGVGKYTARSICANAFGQHEPILDTNVIRILERFFGIVAASRVKSRCSVLWNAAEMVAPVADTSRWNLTLLDFGAKVCTAKLPHCQSCLLQSRCSFSGIVSSKNLAD